MNKKMFGVVFISLILVIPLQVVVGVSLSGRARDSAIDVDPADYLDVIDMIHHINESLLSYYLEGLVDIGPRFVGSENCSEAALFLYYEFRKLGLDVQIEPWKFPRYSCQNVVATLEGTDKSSDAVVVVCAHYDTISQPKPYDRSPGALDDGTGVAAMLAIANICSHYSFNHTIRFAAVSGEEVGTFGSYADAKKAYEGNENIIAVLNIDTIGYANTTSTGKLLSSFAKDSSKWIISTANQVAEKYAEQLDITVENPLYYPADHDSYCDFGYCGVMFVQPLIDECHWIHTANDTLDKVNMSYFVKASKLLLATTVELALKPIDIQVRIVTPYEECIYITDRVVFPLIGFNLYRFGFRAMTYLLGKPIVRVNISTEEEIKSVHFGVDGFVLHIDHEPPYEWKIQRTLYSFFPLVGIHTLNVCVCTESGKNAYDEMDIFVLRPLLYRP